MTADHGHGVGGRTAADENDRSLRSGGTRRALANPSYRWFMAGQLLGQTGGWMQRIAQTWLVLELTESPLVLGTVVTLQFMPILLLSLFAGVLADRFPKKAALISIQLVNVVQASLFTVLVATGWIQLWHIYVLAMIQGTASAMEQPLRQSLPMELVGRELIVYAVALNSAVHNSARILGPALGGVVVALLDVKGAFALNALTHGLVLGTLVMMQMTQRVLRTTPRGNPLAEIGDSLRFAAGNRTMVFTLGALSCLGIFGFNYSTFLPIMARNELQMGPSGYGTLSAALGVGAILGAAVVARQGYTSPLRQVGGGVAFAALLLGVGLSPWLVVSVLLLGGLGVAGTLFTTTANTTLQLTVPDDMRGRIMGLYTLLLAGMTPPGAMVTGALSDLWGIRTALGIEAAICLLGVLVAGRYLVSASKAQLSQPQPTPRG